VKIDENTPAAEPIERTISDEVTANTEPLRLEIPPAPEEMAQESFDAAPATAMPEFDQDFDASYRGAVVQGAVATDPKKSARAAKFSREMGIPLDAAEQNLLSLEQTRRAHDVMLAVEDDPAMKAMMADSTFAASAHDQVEPLGEFSRAVQNLTVGALSTGLGGTIKGLGVFPGEALRTAVRAVEFAGESISGGGTGLTGRTPLMDAGAYLRDAYAPRVVEELFTIAGQNIKDYWGSFAPAAEQASDIDPYVQAFGQLGFQVPLAMLNPVAGAIGMTAMGADIMEEKISKDPVARRRASEAAQDLETVLGAGVTGLTETISNTMFGGMLKGAQLKAVSASLATRIGSYLTKTAVGGAGEAVQETLEQLGQDWAHIAITNSEAKMAYTEALEAGKVGGVVGAVFAAMLQAFAGIRVRRLGRTFGELADSRKAQEFATRDPQGFKELTDVAVSAAAAANEGQAVTDLYMDANTFQQAMVAIGQDPTAVAEAIGQGQQFADALATGGSFKIPTATFANQLAGQEIGDALTPHVRGAADAKSIAELEQMQKTIADHVAKQAKEVNVRQEARKEWRESANEVKAVVEADLTAAGVYGKPYIKLMSEFVKNFYTVAAEREGMLPKQMFDKIPYRHLLGVAGPAPADPNILNQSAWHGSPYTFDKFTTAKIGTGEGHQSYGWGMYFAGLEEVAKHYRDAIKDKSSIAKINSRLSEIARELEPLRAGEYGKFKSPRGYELKAEYDRLMDEKLSSKGRVYKVELAPAEDEYLLLDTPMDDQSDKVKKAFVAAFRESDTAPGPDGQPADPDSMSDDEILGEYETGREAYNGISDNLRSDDRSASLLLLKHGIKGSKFLDRGSRSAGEGSYNYVIFSDDDVEITEFYQAQQNSAGARSGYDPARLAHIMTTSSDPSSFFHEAGHFFLDMYGRFASAENANPFYQKEMQTILDWFGVKDLATWNAMTMDEQRQFHEKFAYSYEQYLQNGKAPTKGLKKLFETFSKWITETYRALGLPGGANDVYKSLYGEGLPALTGEMKQVLDRMLAAEQDIEHAEAVAGMAPLFQTKPDGMSDDEWAAYQGLLDEAHEEALGDHRAASVRQMKWLSGAKSRAFKALQAQADREREYIRAEVEETVKARPVRQAEAYLSQSLDDPDTETILRIMPKELWGEHAAEKFGFTSADELEKALGGLMPLEEEIGLLVDQRMLEEHSDLATAQDVENAANAAVHNEARAKFIAVELRFLAKALRPVQVMIDAARAAAETVIGRTKVGELRPSQYYAAEARSDRAARDAMAKGDTAAAIQHLQAKLFQNQLAAEAMRVKTEMAQSAEYLREVQTPKSAKKIGLDALEQIMGILEKFDLKPRGRNADVNPLTTAWQQERKAERDRFIAVEKEALLASAGAVDARAKAELLVKGTPGIKAKADAHIAQWEKSNPRPARMSGMTFRAWVAEQLKLGHLPDVAIELLPPKARAAYLAEVQMRNADGDLLIADEAEAIQLLATYIDAAGQQSYRDMTVNDFRGIHDTVRNIAHLGKSETLMMTMEKEITRQEAEAEIARGIVANAKEGGKATRTAVTKRGKTEQWLRQFAASHVVTSVWARIMDGGKDAGPVWKWFVRSANERAAWETEQRALATQKLSDLLNPVREKVARKDLIGKGTFFPSIGESLNWEQRLAVALNYGNESNLQRLLDGTVDENRPGWKVEQLLPVLQSLTTAEWNAVQGIWDHMESYRDQVAAKGRKLEGREPTWIKPRAFAMQTADGEVVNLRGGYYPVVYDPRLSLRADQHATAEDAKQAMKSAYSAATTRRSFTKERAAQVIGRPVMLSLQGLYSGTNDVIHDLAWHEWVIDTNKLLRSPAIDSAIRDYYGPEVKKEFDKWRDDIVAGSRRLDSTVEQAAGILRQSVSAAGLGYNVVSAAMQPLGLINTASRIGWDWTGVGTTRVVSDPMGELRWCRDKSTFFKNRTRTRFRDLNELRNKIQGQSKFREIEAGYRYSLMMMTQQWVDAVTFIGAYEKAMADGNFETKPDGTTDDRLAVAIADQAVKDSQGGGEEVDQAGVERGGPAMKIFTNFYGFMRVTSNVAYLKTQTESDRAAMAVNLLAVLSLAPLLGALLKEAIIPGGDDDRDWKGLAKKLAAEQVSFLLGLVAVGREFAQLGKIAFDPQGPARYEGPAGLRTIGDTMKFTEQALQLEFDHAFARSFINLMGDVFGLPSAQINRTVAGAKALAEGETANPAALVFGYQKR
jgi:hypothetical protein